MKTKTTTEWNFALLYKSEKDPQIEKDIRHLEALCASFEKKYKGKDFISTAQKLKTVLGEYAKTIDETLAKPWWYFALRNEAKSDDAKAAAMATHMQERMSLATNKVTFCMLEIGKIPVVKQKEYLKSSVLMEYRYLLEKIFTQAKYNLTEKEEQLNGLLRETSYSMWVYGQTRFMAEKTISFKGEQISISKAEKTLENLPKKERRELYVTIIKTYKDNSVFAEAEFNAICNYKKTLDVLRGYKKPYSETLLSNENDEKTIESLVAVVTKYFSISHKFYALHAKLLGEKTITRADRSVRIGKIERAFTFDESVAIVKNAFSSLDKKYATFVQTIIDNGQVDAYPRTGKQGTSFCWDMGYLPTFVSLNHLDDLRSVEVLAHEMGHAIHGQLERVQPIQYKGHSTATAEVASTFFEQLVSDEIAKKLSEEEQMILLHSKILNDVACIFAQISGFNFEVALHEKIRAEGQLSRSDIAALLQKNIAAFTGKAVVTTPDDGYHFVGWWHMRMFFYVYTYAYGQLISRSLYEKWKADPSYAKKIEQFLSAGRSMSPKEIFKSIGITTNEAFFEAGLKGIEADIIKLEKLAKKFKKI